jgi:hypothetical protein
VEEENARLKRLVADLSLDKHILTEALRKKSGSRPASSTGLLASWDVSGEWRAGLSVGPVRSSLLVSKEPGQRPDGVATWHSRCGACSTSLWLSAGLGLIAAGGQK